MAKRVNPCLRTQRGTTPPRPKHDDETPKPMASTNPIVAGHHHVAAPPPLGKTSFFRSHIRRGNSWSESKQEAEFERGRPSISTNCPLRWWTWSGDVRERLPTASGKGQSRWLAAGSSPLHGGVGLVAVIPGIDDPHRDSADEQRPGNHISGCPVLLVSTCAAAALAPSVNAKAISVSEMGWFSRCGRPFSPLGKVRMKSTIRLRNPAAARARIAPN